MKTVQAGRLRRWMTFEVLVVDVDSEGATVEAWLPAFAVNHIMPCELTPISGKELIAAAALQSVVTHRIKTRYREGFAARMRATERGVAYNIEAVIEDPDSGIRFITLLASAGASQGN
jgi:SPP1 family predicted phage head-tail adaptor